MPERRAHAFAKLTLSLHVVGRRPDGYHELDALVVSLDEPYDIVTVAPAPATTLTVDGAFASGVPADASNLAWRAAEAAGAVLRIRLTKGIPNGAGLGGGSADAAAVLVACGADARVAASLGADVPFCARGGAARVRGAGEIVEPVAVAPIHALVAAPPFRCATADVYRAWDALGGPRGREVDARVGGLAPLRNDLEPAAEHVEPRLRVVRDALEHATGRAAILAGSGSSHAVLFDDLDAARDARERVATTVHGSVWVGSLNDRGVAFCDSGD